MHRTLVFRPHLSRVGFEAFYAPGADTSKVNAIFQTDCLGSPDSIAIWAMSLGLDLARQFPVSVRT